MYALFNAHVQRSLWFAVAKKRGPSGGEPVIYMISASADRCLV